MKTNRRQVFILLILAVFVSFFVRFWKISTLPFPPNGDELAFGYYGWSLLHFAKDEYGNTLPLNFPSIGDFKYPTLAYLNIIPAVFFALSEITVRFWNAVSGILLVLLIYKLSLFIFNKRTAALASAWLIALSPWSIIESRFGWENHISMVLTTAGVLLLFISFTKSDSKNRIKLYIVSLIMFLISSFCYGAQRIFIPLFLFSLTLLTLIKETGFYKERRTIYFLFIAISTVIFISLLSPQNRGRASEEVWRLIPQGNDRLQQLYIGAGISDIKIPARLTWFFHNKYRLALTDFLDRYLDHFNPKFLFFYGEASAEKIPDMGVLLFIEIILLPAGILTFLNKNKKSLIILFWLIIAPIASSLTFGGAHINRASIMIPPIALISGFGFKSLTEIFKNRIKLFIGIILTIGILISSAFALNQIFIQKPQDKPWLKEQVYKKVVLEILNLKGNFDAVALTDDDYIYFLFYGKISPQDFISRAEILPLNSQNKWERVNRLDNIYFKMPYDCPRAGKLNVLYVCSGVEVPQNSKVLKTFYYKDKVPAFTFVEFYPISDMPQKLTELPENLHYMVEVEKNLNFQDGIIPEKYPQLW